MKLIPTILLLLISSSICEGQTFSDVKIHIPESYQFKIDTTFIDSDGSKYTLLKSSRFNIKGKMVMEILVKRSRFSNQESNKYYFDYMENYFSDMNSPTQFETINGQKYIISGTKIKSENDSIIYLLVAHTINDNNIYSFNIRTDFERSIGWIYNLLNDIKYI